MKRAPVIPKHTIKTQPLEDTPSSAPAAPMVDSLIARVGAMARGNAITLPVCGRDVKFTLEVLRGDSVEKTSRVWSGNERDQELLTEDALDDLIPSFLLTGQQTPAFGRRVSGVIEIADGSRRRKAAALTESDYRVLVGELDDEQMAALSRLGNDYRPTSAYERGQRYASRLQNEFAGNISALADAENISRKIITRCINTAKLPKSVVALFSHPGELSARSGDALQRAFTDKEELLKQQASNLHEQKKAGVIFEAEEVITLLTSVLKTSSASRTSLSSRHQFAPGATVLYKGDKMVLNLDRSRIPTECIERIEAILKELEKAAQLAGSRIYVYVELDVGMQRCGVSDFDQVLYLARQIEKSGYLEFGGIQAYAGQLSHEEDPVTRIREIHKIETLLRQGKAYLEQHHVTVREISGASTATAGEKAKGGVYTEIQAGSYLFMDASYRRCGLPFESALSVVSTIISKSENRIVLDVGVKNLGMDQRDPEIAGQRPEDSLSFSEEHTAVYRDGIGRCNPIGSQVAVLPGHCCTTVNTFDWILIKEGDEILDRWRIDGRGKSW